ncbi:MAG TPA: hypothetical protein VFA50_08075 [Stellaceae bacterium]|nr:hypothetical protein [Stellaceae bacterium]
MVAHARREAEDDDLLDYAAAQTLRQGGMVAMVPREALPGAGVAAALLRY